MFLQIMGLTLSLARKIVIGNTITYIRGKKGLHGLLPELLADRRMAKNNYVKADKMPIVDNTVTMK